jgi:hypothetical protein
MRPCSAGLAAFLSASDSAVIADLYSFALVGGEMLRWSGFTTALTVPAAGFPSGSINAGAERSFALGPRFGRSKITTKIGIEPTELNIEIYAAAGDLVGSLPLAEAVRLGLFDGATVELDRLFAPPQPSGSGTLDTSLGVLLWFYGRVAECEVGRSTITVRVKSLMNLLALQQIPRRLYQASCGHVFGDTMCGYDRTAGESAAGTPTGVGAVTIAAQSGSNQAQIVTTFSPSPATAYDQGTMTCLTGANAGASRTIRSLTSGVLYQLQPWLSPVAFGDTFELLPGCDHTTATCDATFQNLDRFGGFPYIPPPEAAA